MDRLLACATYQSSVVPADMTTTAATSAKSETSHVDVRGPLLFRFAIASIALTGVAVSQIEVERRTLQAQHEYVRAVAYATAVVDRQNRLDVELAKLSAPQALLLPTDNGSDDDPRQLEIVR